MGTRSFGDHRRGAATVLGRDPGACLRAGPGFVWAGVVSTFIMGLGTAITVAAIASLAVGAKAWARRLAGTRSGYGMLAMRGIEVGAAALIVAFGTLLLTGYVASERMIGV